MVQISQRLMLQQKQSPQQVLLSTLLQLPVLRLEQRIKQELEINPLLELDTDLEEDLTQAELEELKQKEEEEEEEEEEEVDKDSAEDLEVDWDSIINDEDNYEVRTPKEHVEDEIDRPEPAPVTLMDHIIEQLYLAPLNDEQKLIGEYILWCIDDMGYLACPLEIISENISAEVEEIEIVLKVIQTFDPPGIAARDLQNCLLIQLRESDDPDDNAIQMLEECFVDFSNKRFEKISKKMDVELYEVKRMMEVVSKLNPKPGERYVFEAENYIIPDVLIEKVDGHFTISLNDWNIPRLRINESYKRLLKDKKAVGKETRDYIRQRLESARWLINSIYQRRSTIQRVMESILNHQRAFFEKGKEHLRPMILKDIAEDVSLDISTVSRVTNGKYVQTDFGVYELKFFFSERMETLSGEDVSNKLIKDKIKKMIENENHQKPLNDQTLSESLAEDGFKVARRTVAKYREQMMIPVARLRRQIE
ncbi:RNA polymerase factor sigma-54 [bacterium]|nr:RNA polymerase factor sigma-54 [bacterium]